MQQMTIDGVDQFDAIYSNGSSARTEILLQLDPPATFFGTYFVGQAAIRRDNWKLIVGQVCAAVASVLAHATVQPNCTMNEVWTNPYVPFEDYCPSGFVSYCWAARATAMQMGGCQRDRDSARAKPVAGLAV